MKHIFNNWAIILLSALTILLVMLIIDTAWPVAYVHISSIPSGAIISDGEGFEWISPAVIPVQHEGLNVTLTHPQRVSVDTLLLPEMAAEPVIVSLPFRFPVNISSEPSGVSVLIDGSFSGYTPLHTVIDEPGMHQLTLVSSDEIMIEDSFSLLFNDPCSLHCVLPRIHPSGMLLIPPKTSGSQNLLNPYLIGKYEVTNREFCEYLRMLEPFPVRDTSNRWGRTDILESMFPGDYPLPFYIDSAAGWKIQDGLHDLPVAGLTVNTALGYCEWISLVDSFDLSYRLPTGEEWFNAAVAGGGGPWPWGSQRPDGNLLNLSDSNESLLRRHPSIDDGYAQAAPVGSFPSNNWGLHDMAGNLWEYCMPVHSDSAVEIRGGSWLSSMEDCRCDAKMYPDSGLGYHYAGFRIAASPPSREQIQE